MIPEVALQHLKEKATKTNIPWRTNRQFAGLLTPRLMLGGWPILESAPAPKDSDHDGMPDDWEDKHKLDKNNPEDRNTIASDGYTMLEKYLNSII
jgi:hypothetical protein